MSKPARRAPGDAPILVTMGEPAGIGPEIAVAAFKSLGGKVGRHPLLLVGDASVFESCGFGDQKRHHRDEGPRGALGGKTARSQFGCCHRSDQHGRRARPVWRSGRHRDGARSTKPFSSMPASPIPDTPNISQALTGVPRAVMMLAEPTLRVVPVTIHLALRGRDRGAHQRGDRRDRPRLSIAALRAISGLPHRSSQSLGSTRMPARMAGSARGDRHRRARGRPATRRRSSTYAGRSPPTRCSTQRRGASYDAALCMYHDQALIPIKTIDLGRAVNVTLGLPFIRTSPDHGTAFDIAGTGKADPRSLIAAIRMAAQMADAAQPQERSDRPTTLPPLREVIAAMICAPEIARTEFSPRPQSDPSHRARRWSAREGDALRGRSRTGRADARPARGRRHTRCRGRTR